LMDNFQNCTDALPKTSATLRVIVTSEGCETYAA